MALPEGTRVVVTDTPEVWCVVRVNCYHAPTRTIVLVPGQSLKALAHEGCHAHQHATVLAETGGEPSLDLHEWFTTAEAVQYAAVVAQAGPNEWGEHYTALLEDFAEACGRFLTDYSNEPGRAAFFEARGFK